METNKRRVIGVYQSEADAQRAVEDLLNMGYTSDEISVVSKSAENTTAADGAETAVESGLKGGAAAGATIGGVGGLLAGLGLLVIPGIGPILAAGPIAAAFAGAVAGGAIGGTIGTLGGAMMDAGVDETDARYIDERFQAGDIVVYVDADTERFDRVSDTLGYRRWNTEYDDYKPDTRAAGTVDPAAGSSDRTYDMVNTGDAMRTGGTGTGVDPDTDRADAFKADLNRAENRVEDTITDTKHEAMKNVEKVERRADNAGEPLEDVKNWAGDRVSDVKHEAGKLIDKAKNRTDD